MYHVFVYEFTRLIHLQTKQENTTMTDRLGKLVGLLSSIVVILGFLGVVTIWDLLPSDDSGAESSNTFTTSESIDFVDNYLEALNSSNVRKITSMYADYVDYFGAGIVDKDFIIEDKADFYRRWPEVNYRLLGRVIVENENSELVKRLIFSFRFHTYSSSRNRESSGTAENTLIVEKIEGVIKIVNEKQVVSLR